MAGGSEILNNSSREKSHIITSCFRRLGLALPIDGSCNSELSVKGLQGLWVGDWNQTSIDVSAEKKNDITGREGKSRAQQSKWETSQFYQSGMVS